MNVRILLVPNATNAEAVKACSELATWSAARGLEPVMSVADARSTGLDGFGVEPSEIGAPALAVALGGDGTILKAVHLLGDVPTPILGIKFGRLGFLSGARPERARDAVEAALAGEAIVERRTTLGVEVIMGGRSVGAYRALNEVVVSRGQSGRMVTLDVLVSGHRVSRVNADGIIVATATGSTAYALSAGGPIVAPGFRGMVIVPVAPHTLRVRPVVTEPSDIIDITLPDRSRSDACLFVDGAATPCRRDIERIVVSRGEHDVPIVKLEGRDFYETVAEEFFEGR